MGFWSQSYVKLTLKYLWIISLIVLIWQGYSAYLKLPVQVATHFNSSGVPNGWSSRTSFFTVWGLTMVGMNAMWLLSVFLLPRCLRAKFAQTVNIPNRDYWLSTDERRVECGRLMNAMMFGVAFMTNALFIVIFHSIVQSNINPGGGMHMERLLIIVALLLIFIGVYLLTAFRKAE